MTALATHERRIAKLEQQVDVLTRAIHLLTTSAKPTSDWLDAKMANIEETNR